MKPGTSSFDDQEWQRLRRERLRCQRGRNSVRWRVGRERKGCPVVQEAALIQSRMVRLLALAVSSLPTTRRVRYAVQAFLGDGDAKRPSYLQTPARCPKARSASIHDRSKAVYEGLMAR